MGGKFKFAFTGDFLGKDGSPVHWKGNLPPLEAAKDIIEHRFIEHHTKVITSDQVADSEGLLVLGASVTTETLKNSNRLKVISRWGVGFENVDVESCTQADVAVTISKGAVNHPVGESIITYMLALSHNLFDKDRLVRQNQWDDRNDYLGTEIREKRLGVVGLGGIGSKLVDLLSGMGMLQPLAYDPNLSEAEISNLGVQKVSLETLMKESDFVSINCPLNETSKDMIGPSELALMKPTAFLINTARGGIVNEKALVEVLRNKKIRAAGIDVFEQEPTTDQNLFIDLNNVILTPHSICWTEECFRDIGQMAVNSIVSVAKGEKPHGILNPEVWDRPGFQAKLAEQLRR